ncbi:Flp family type IVb pilin [Aliihoeflea aestuarii]|jgi:pilus assembly protein Flp/PilA|uniref:Flp family type IVb pilin n=1 Tax=Aliihoeflea aestuarii TaxID=453840 RepID=UPI002093A26C|nr:Flp family type IVb pilin [Aliihoeflea aestuarii]MCO6391966.1 Flp family type IVb pilin [Aliihoeflea aestuarii]
MTNLLKRFKNDESGATAIEYGLIAALIGVTIIGAAGLLGDELVTTFTNIDTALSGANTVTP